MISIFWTNIRIHALIVFWNVNNIKHNIVYINSHFVYLADHGSLQFYMVVLGCLVNRTAETGQAREGPLGFLSALWGLSVDVLFVGYALMYSDALWFIGNLTLKGCYHEVLRFPQTVLFSLTTLVQVVRSAPLKQALLPFTEGWLCSFLFLNRLMVFFSVWGFPLLKPVPFFTSLL